MKPERDFGAASDRALAAIVPTLSSDVTARSVNLGGGRFTIEVTVGGHRLLPVVLTGLEEHELEEGLRRRIAAAVAEYRREKGRRAAENGDRDVHS
jgi:hypothetical protein